MPELPDIVVYIEALELRILGHTLERVQVAGPSLLRTATPPIECAQGHKVTTLRRVENGLSSDWKMTSGWSSIS